MENHLCGSWSVSEDTPVTGAFNLKELSVIEVTGEDAAEFLHGQFTNHIKNLGSAFRLAAYCQPQGRILALMRVLKKEDSYYLVMPCDLVEGFIKRLSMFILRSKVVIKLRDDLTVYGLIAPQGDLPAVDEIVMQGEMVLARVTDWGDSQRALAIGPKTVLASHYPEAVESSRWFESEIETGTPWVFAKTKEAFIPQWINLEKIGGLVFDKGCYPGQEIISRVQHIGSTPRRMTIVKADSNVSLNANDDVFCDGEACGNVVMSVTNGNETKAIVEVTLKSMEKGSYRIGNEEFVKQPLPYAL